MADLFEILKKQLEQEKKTITDINDQFIKLAINHPNKPILVEQIITEFQKQKETLQSSILGKNIPEEQRKSTEKSLLFYDKFIDFFNKPMNLSYQNEEGLKILLKDLNTSLLKDIQQSDKKAMKSDHGPLFTDKKDRDNFLTTLGLAFYNAKKSILFSENLQQKAHFLASKIRKDSFQLTQPSAAKEEPQGSPVNLVRARRLQNPNPAPADPTIMKTPSLSDSSLVSTLKAASQTITTSKEPKTSKERKRRISPLPDLKDNRNFQRATEPPKTSSSDGQNTLKDLLENALKTSLPSSKRPPHQSSLQQLTNPSVESTHNRSSLPDISSKKR